MSTIAAASGDLPPILSCGCHGHLAREVFYTSVFRDDSSGAYVVLSGPYATHDEALAAVDADRAWVHDVLSDPRAPWYAYGTCSALPEVQMKPRRALFKP